MIDVDPTLTGFVGSLTYYALFTFVVLAALSQLGIQTTSFIAVIGAAVLADGRALQVYNRTPKNADALTAAGVVWADTPALAG